MKKLGAFSGCLMVLLMLAFMTGVTYEQAQTGTNENLNFKDNVTLQVVRDGKVIFQTSTHNVITNAGMNFTQYKISQTSSVDADFAQYIAVSSTDAEGQYTDTTMAGEQAADGLTREAGTFVAGVAATGDVTYYLYYNYTYSGAGITIYRAGLFTKSSGGVLYAMAKFGSAAILASGDKLNVQWSITGEN